MTLAREIDGRTVPAAGTYTIDPAHSKIEAVARHLMVTKVRGHFAAYEGTITVADDPTQSSVELTIQADSITTGTDDRDGHLRSPDFLDNFISSSSGFFNFINLVHISFIIKI